MSVDPAELELLNAQLHQAQKRAIAAELSARGLKEVGHPMLLSILETSEGAPENVPCPAQRDLASQLNVSPAAISSSLKSLEKGGYIRREPGENDARRTHVMLTEKGRKAVDGCHAAFKTVLDRMMAGITEEEQISLLHLRQRMLANLQPEKEVF